VCWNAGVACSGGPGAYDECHAQDWDVGGAPVDAASAAALAVLHPLGRYLGPLAERGAYLAALDGVPPGYAEGVAEITYAGSPDPQNQLDYGIGFVCNSPTNGFAIPSVRVRELVESLSPGERNDFSICEPSYEPALSTIAARIVQRLQ
jgi:hypothetical protein